MTHIAYPELAFKKRDIPLQDSTHSILHSAKRFFSGTMLSRITGLFRDIAMAYAFGTQEAIGAFLVAFRFSHLLRRLLGEGALQTAFVPQFEKLRKESSLRAIQFFGDLTSTLMIILAFVIAVTMGALAAVIQWGNLSHGNAEITWLTFLMMPSLFFICLYGLNAAFLQCEKSFFTSSVAPVAFNLFWIIGVVCLYHLPTSQAMSGLAGFIIIACFAQWAATIPKTNVLLNRISDAPRKKRVWLSSDVRLLLAPLALGVFGIGAAQINNALDAIFARYADEAGPAFLWYSIRIQQLPLALFGIAISGALLPPLSRAIKAKDFVKFSFFLDFAIRRSIALMLPLSLGMILLGAQSVHLLYGRGDFDLSSTIGTTWCLWGYALGLIPMTLILIIAPAYYAQENYRTPTRASTLSVFLNIGLNALLVMGMGYGAASVAIATSVSAWFNLVMLTRGMQPKTESLMTKKVYETLFKTAGASLVGCVSVVAFEMGFSNSSPLVAMIQGMHLQFASSLIQQAAWLSIDAVIFAASFFAAAWIFKADDILKFHTANSESTT